MPPPVTRPHSLTLRHETLPLKSAFKIARGSKTVADVLVAEVGYGDCVGYGESVPYKRYGETIENCLQQARPCLQNPPDRYMLQSLLPAGATRNAIDCALWDLEARLAGVALETLLGLSQPQRIRSAYTIGADAPQACQTAAMKHSDKSLLKLKFAGDGDDIRRLTAVRQQRPDADIIVDANESWTQEIYLSHIDKLTAAGVKLLEQPFPENKDEILRDLPHPIPVCADESCRTTEDLPRLHGLYDAVNIKLDKCGGLTHAAELHSRAKTQGFAIMIGCMVASSLAVKPALPLCNGADWVDLDAPLWLKNDRKNQLQFNGNIIIKQNP